MDTVTALAIIALAGLMHATFQLSISMVTLLSSHSIGKKHSGAQTTRLTLGFLGGTVTMTMLVVSFLTAVLNSLFRAYIPLAVWAVVCGLLIGLGIAIWVFYYRRQAGTALWIPRSMARFLSTRAKSATSASKSFSLGLTSVIAELIFMIAPALAAACSLSYLPHRWQLPALFLYTLIASLGAGIVVVLIGSGHKISDIQRWREQNKHFLQFIAGSGFLVLGAFIYANVVALAAVAGNVTLK